VNAAAQQSIYDYSKYSGGAAAGGGASASGKSTKSHKAGKGSDAGGAQAGGGFDYSKYMSGGKTMNAAAQVDDGKSKQQDEEPGKFDYHKFMKHLADVKLASTNNAASSQNDAGEEGGPCGITPYKDFGKCKPKLKCQVTPLFSAYAPGKCVKKPAPAVVGVPNTNNAADSNNDGAGDVGAAIGKTAKTEAGMINNHPGSLNGPCGKWALGGMDFGSCVDGLECVDQDDVKLTFNGHEYGFPSVCKNTTVSSDADVVANVADDDDTSTDADSSDDYDQQGLSRDDMHKAADAVADAANSAALRAADAAEVLANKLLAAAAKVREAAAKLKAEAAQLQDDHSGAGGDDDVAPAVVDGQGVGDEVSMIASKPGSSHWMVYILAIVAVIGAAYAYRSHSENQYHRI